MEVGTYQTGPTIIKTMSSREIAELVDSRHDAVKRTVETLMAKGVIQLTQPVEVKNHLGQRVAEYRLVERDVIVQPPMVDEPEKDAMGRTRC